MDVGDLTTAINAVADLRYHLPAPLSSSPSFIPAAVADFPQNTKCIGPGGLVLMLQNLFDSTIEIGETFAPTFPPLVKKALGVPFLEGFIAVGSQHANFERWVSISPTQPNDRAYPMTVMNIDIMTELNNHEVSIGIANTMVARVLYLVKATLKSRPDLTKDFIRLGGVCSVRCWKTSRTTRCC